MVGSTNTKLLFVIRVTIQLCDRASFGFRRYHRHRSNQGSEIFESIARTLLDCHFDSVHAIKLGMRGFLLPKRWKWLACWFVCLLSYVYSLNRVQLGFEIGFKWE